MRRYDYSDSVVLLAEEEGFGLEIPRRYETFEDLSSSDDFEWQVTYKFTSDFRNNHFGKHIYGGKYMTFRKLYEILCQRYNDGEYFLDTYFNDVFPYTLKPDMDKYLENLKQEVVSARELEIAEEVETLVAQGKLKLTKSGRLRKTGARNKGYIKKLSETPSFYSDYVKEEGKYLAERIKDDIVMRLHLGEIPLVNSSLSAKTVKKRAKAGLPEYPKFFASGQFINNLLVFVRLEKKQWQTKYQPIMV